MKERKPCPYYQEIRERGTVYFTCTKKPTTCPSMGDKNYCVVDLKEKIKEALELEQELEWHIAERDGKHLGS